MYRSPQSSELNRCTPWARRVAAFAAKARAVNAVAEAALAWPWWLRRMMCSLQCTLT